MPGTGRQRPAGEPARAVARALDGTLVAGAVARAVDGTLVGEEKAVAESHVEARRT